MDEPDYTLYDDPLIPEESKKLIRIMVEEMEALKISIKASGSNTV